MANTNLAKAKRAKQDEFYTQRIDIEKEMEAYISHNPDVFRDKTILLPCDDPEWSNFTKYFVNHFTDFGVKKLISSSYSQKPHQESLFADDTHQPGKYFILEQGDKVPDVDAISYHYLKGDGSFLSEEVTAFRDQADMVISNPPFSLFRDFIDWLVEGGVDFAVIGNMNAITYKNVFPLIMGNKLWLGATGNTTGMMFRLPDGVEMKQADAKRAARAGIDYNVAWLGNTCWYSTISHGHRNTPLQLSTMEENLQSGNAKITAIGYQLYDNINAIEVPITKAIPSDYDGVMGVPISFLNYYNPDQFEIVGSTENKFYSKELVLPGKNYGAVTLHGKQVYKRILIQHKK